MNKSSPGKEAAVNTDTKESSNAYINLAMDQDTYKQRLRELRVSREELRYLIRRFPVELMQELGSQGVEMKRKSICQSMKSFDRNISSLVLDLEGNRSAEDALRIEEVELLGKEAKKELIDHKVLIYEALASYARVMYLRLMR